MSLFAKAAAKAKVEEPKAKADAPAYTPEDALTRKAIDDFVASKEAEKKAENAKKKASATALPWARKLLAKLFCEKGSQPETFYIQGSTSKAMLIAQDRTAQYNLKDEQLAALKTILGEPRAESLIEEFTEFSLENAVLNLPGVADAISKAIEAIPSTVLNDDQKSALLVGKARRILKGTTIDKLPELCGGDPIMVNQVMDILGSHFTTYLL